MLSDLDALTRSIVENPWDMARWLIYADAASDADKPEWEELARRYVAANGEERNKILIDHWQTWPVAHAVIKKNMIMAQAIRPLPAANDFAQTFERYATNARPSR